LADQRLDLPELSVASEHASGGYHEKSKVMTEFSWTDVEVFCGALNTSCDQSDAPDHDEADLMFRQQREELSQLHDASGDSLIFELSVVEARVRAANRR
jgi:hypothetical protein